MSRVSSDVARRHRLNIAWRDGARCFYCHTPFPDPKMTGATLDHYIPHSLWPSSQLANLVLACFTCNQAKADILPWPLAWLLLHIAAGGNPTDLTPEERTRYPISYAPKYLPPTTPRYTTIPDAWRAPRTTMNTTPVAVNTQECVREAA
ncbi:HNH endonuclease signature motif containing protein [Streptomyces sp. DSM 44915]|uniref:HNH endonuclease signature motif containing protein n=1 Tax=Streptomyces chisholmiae TaxID=3075540 RepID=A0ABU2JVQ8_9ACTN|nr:HNH endonuclease signature motif containing protein [Streptomyces sp. DSM 44915]MDT0268313.1 HNH endonuclease signature motif containing protein [Streptomyces sp. DSM 44915]